MRVGKKGFPNYRIIAIDKRKKRDGAYIEKLGFYDPLTNPMTLTIDEQKLAKWREKGALISEGLTKLLKKYSKKV